MKLRKLKNGRIKDMDSSLIVSDKLAKSIMNGKPIPKLRAKKSKRGNKNTKKEHAINTVTIKQYKDGFDINFGNRGMNQTEMLYLGYYLTQMAKRKINRDISHDSRKKRLEVIG